MGQTKGKVKSAKKKNAMGLVAGLSVSIALLMVVLGVLAQISPEIVDTDKYVQVVYETKTGDAMAGVGFTGRIVMWKDDGTADSVLLLKSYPAGDPDDPESLLSQSIMSKTLEIRSTKTDSGFFLGDPAQKDTMHIDGDALNLFILCLLPLFGPIGFYYTSQRKRIKQLEKRLPDFLRDVAEAGRFGLTLADSIVIASAGRYGKLTPEIKKMAAQIQWNVPVSEVMRLLAERLGTPMVVKMAAIVIKSNEAGGDVADVLGLVSKDAKATQMMQLERELEMSTYIAVIYIAFVVFLVTILILNATFLPQMEEAGRATQKIIAESGQEGANAIQSQVIPAIQFIFILASVSHAVGDGLIAGSLHTGKVLDGFKHTAIMVGIAFLMLRMM